jgi:hypothetical protein
MAPKSRLLQSLLSAGANTAKGVVNYGVPGAAGVGAGVGLYNNTVPDDASTVEKIEGGTAAGLLGLGAGSFLNPRAWRNAHIVAKRQALEDAAAGLSPDYTSHLTKGVTKNVLLPKATFAGLALLPSAAIQAQQLGRDSAEAARHSSEAAGNISATTKTFRELATAAGKTDESGQNIADRLRQGLEQMTANATTATGAVAQGAQDVSHTISEGTRNITSSLADAAKSTAGMSENASGIAKALAPIAAELGQKDEYGKSPMANLNEVLGTIARVSNTGKLQQYANSAMNSAKVLETLKKYAPQAALGGAGAAGLYGLYRLLQNRSTKKKENNMPQEKFARVYEAAEHLDGEKPKVTMMNHKCCTPGEFGARVKESTQQSQPAVKPQSAYEFGTNVKRAFLGDYTMPVGVGGAAGAALGGMAGLANPGEEDEYDSRGNVIGKKRKSRLGSALSGAMTGLVGGGMAGGAAQHFGNVNEYLQGLFKQQPPTDAPSTTYRENELGMQNYTPNSLERKLYDQGIALMARKNVTPYAGDTMDPAKLNTLMNKSRMTPQQKTLHAGAMKQRPQIEFPR